jgi:hypothetical protein
MQQLADQNAEATRLITALKAELAAERIAETQLRMLVAELSLELEHTREQLTAAMNVTPLRTEPSAPARSRNSGPA